MFFFLLVAAFLMMIDASQAVVSFRSFFYSFNQYKIAFMLVVQLESGPES